MRFRPADEIERREHDWGVFAPVSSPADGATLIMAVLSPGVGDAGYEVEELAADEPWRSMRGGA